MVGQKAIFDISLILMPPITTLRSRACRYLTYRFLLIARFYLSKLSRRISAGSSQVYNKQQIDKAYPLLESHMQRAFSK